jgi:hypothetical protein
MDLSVSDVYHLTVDKLKLVCLARGLDSSGPVRILRQTLSKHVRDSKMQASGDEGSVQVGSPSESGDEAGAADPPQRGDVLRGGSGGSQVVVLVELLRQIPPLKSEEPEAIMALFVWLDETYELGLVDDRTFITRILLLLVGSLLAFVGNCLQEGCTWAACKARLLEDYFPYFVRERLIQKKIVFNLHSETQPVRQYIEQIFRVAKFLQYHATEDQLVARVVMNFHATVSPHATFLERPKSLKDLYRTVGLLEERASITQERSRVESRGQGQDSAERC